MTLFTFRLHDRYGMFIVAIAADNYADAYAVVVERYGNVTVRNVIEEAI